MKSRLAIRLSARMSISPTTGIHAGRLTYGVTIRPIAAPSAALLRTGTRGSSQRQ